MATSTGVTELLGKWRGGDQKALDELMPLVYAELRRLADRYLRRESRGHTLQPTALVNEAYLRLVGEKGVDWESRAHFFGIAAKRMRQILVEHARGKRAEKRGGPEAEYMLSLTAADRYVRREDVNLLALDDALKRLEEFDERKSRIVEMLYFGGLTIEEAAEALGISPATVKRDWSMARAWLRREVGNDNG
jgi:RNA polymerase sigma factor (TIGR02999 family)